MPDTLLRSRSKAPNAIVMVEASEMVRATADPSASLLDAPPSGVSADTHVQNSDSLTGREGSWGVWEVPRTAHTGGSWQIIDGFATEDECAAIVEACAGLEELAEPLARYAAPPTRSDYRSADASRLVSETHDVARALAERAARVTGVPQNPGNDAIMIARTSPALAPGASVDDLPGARAAREGSVDSEGFLLAPDGDVPSHRAAEDDGASSPTASHSAAASTPGIINVHHDHNRDERRSCTVFVYLSSPAAGGETFFPCAAGDLDAEDGDPLAASLLALGASGSHVAWRSPDDAHASDTAAAETETVVECEARLASIRAAGRVPREGVTEGVGCPGLLVSPRAGRAVVFWHGEGADRCAEAWHAPVAVTDDAAGPKWVMTFFKVGDGAGRAESPKTDQVPIAATRAEAEGPVGSEIDPEIDPENDPENDPEIKSPKLKSASAAESLEAEAVGAKGSTVSDDEDDVPVASLVARGVFSGARVDGGSAAANDAAPPSNVEEDEVNPSEMDAELALAALSGGGAHGATEGGSKGAKYKGCCLVDGCAMSRRQPVGNNRLPLTCPEHAGVLTLSYGGRPSRECQACRTFHSLDAFDGDNKTCETRLLRKKLRYRAKTLAAAAATGDAPKVGKKRGRPPNSVKFAQQAANQAAAQMVASQAANATSFGASSHSIDERVLAHLPPHVRAAYASAAMTPEAISAAALASASAFASEARARDQALEQHFAPARAEAERERARLAELARRDASGNGYDATRGGGGAPPVDPATRGGAGVHALLTHARFGGYDPALANHFGLGAGLGPGGLGALGLSSGALAGHQRAGGGERDAQTMAAARANQLLNVAHAIEMQAAAALMAANGVAGDPARVLQGLQGLQGMQGMQGMQGGAQGVPDHVLRRARQDAATNGGCSLM